MYGQFGKQTHKRHQQAAEDISWQDDRQQLFDVAPILAKARHTRIEFRLIGNNRG